MLLLLDPSHAVRRVCMRPSLEGGRSEAGIVALRLDRSFPDNQKILRCRLDERDERLESLGSSEFLLESFLLEPLFDLQPLLGCSAPDGLPNIGYDLERPQTLLDSSAVVERRLELVPLRVKWRQGVVEPKVDVTPEVGGIGGPVDEGVSSLGRESEGEDGARGKLPANAIIGCRRVSFPRTSLETAG